MLPKSDKCFSTCRQISKNKCNPPRCSYTNGKTYQYCRLSRKYKMTKSDNGHCITQKRLSAQSIAKQKIGKFMITAHKKKQLARLEANRLAQIDKIRETMYGRRIKKFMHNTTQKRQSEFLKSICSDAGVCIAFGQEDAKIRHFFNGFTKFDFVHGPITRLGVPSANGFVHEIKYLKNGYEAHAILKSSADVNSDNLFYEFMVGRYLNQLCKKVPCFLETYGIFTYNTFADWEYAKDHAEINVPRFASSFTERKASNNNIIKRSCDNPTSIAILIQHIKDAKTLGQKMGEIKDSIRHSNIGAKQFTSIHLINILYQVYKPLSQFMNSFTHYDLHVNNILLYIPVANKYIHYHYHNLDGSITEFKTEYLVKIIDYGRSFFEDRLSNPSATSNSVRTAVCKVRECDPDCGVKFGYSWLEPEHVPGSRHFIHSGTKNISSDLRLVNIIMNRYRSVIQQDVLLTTILKGTIYDTAYGTKEMLSSGIASHSLHNVNDAEVVFKMCINNPAVKSRNDTYYSNAIWSKLGDLHSYSDGRNMRFVKA